MAQVLVGFEKHWTQSGKERAYAITAFVSQLLNSVVVLLLVNAQASSLPGLPRLQCCLPLLVQTQVPQSGKTHKN